MENNIFGAGLMSRITFQNHLLVFLELATWKNNNFESITNTPVDSLAPADLIFQGANSYKVKVLSTS